MLLTLPEPFETAIAAALKAVPTSQWVSAAQQLSARYRSERGPEGAPAGKPLAQGDVAALGYAALVLPSAYAQLAGALAATAARIPYWQPMTLLDIGSGPGTALWAAADQWPSLQHMTAWEREPAFLALGRRLATAGTHSAVVGASWTQVRLEGTLPRDAPLYDLIIIGHVLNELSEPVQDAVVAWTWAHCAGVLLLVEPGTSAAFPIVRRLRERLLAAGAHTLAPCAHDQPCPLVNDWCHFPQRLERPLFQRRAKEGTANWEEAKFSYAALARFPPDAPIWGRLIHQPHLDKGGVTLIVSRQAGIVRPRIPKRDPAYRQARDYAWGEALVNPIGDEPTATHHAPRTTHHAHP